MDTLIPIDSSYIIIEKMEGEGCSPRKSKSPYKFMQKAASMENMEMKALLKDRKIEAVSKEKEDGFWTCCCKLLGNLFCSVFPRQPSSLEMPPVTERISPRYEDDYGYRSYNVATTFYPPFYPPFMNP
jgi:hypothetical protein